MNAVDPCTEYGVALALEDFLPVLLAGIGTIVLAAVAARYLPRMRNAALAAGCLVTVGGLAKAVWKLFVASSPASGPCRDYPFLEHMLFPCLAFGFAGIACALVGVWRGAPPPWAPFLAVPVLGAIAALAVGDFWPLLVVSAVGAVAVGALGIRLSLRAGHARGAIAFAVYVVGTLVLPPLAARPHQSEALQWAEQCTNTVVQLCFVLGALGLRTQLITPTPVQPEGASL